MKRGDLARLLVAAAQVSPYRDFVVIGSLSVLGAVETPPDEMVGSIDVDLYPRDDPSGAGDIGRALGLGSAFASEHGIYADPVSPMLATLPDGWEERLMPIGFDSDVTGWFLEPHDAAISKYARGEVRDLRWTRAGVLAGILLLDRLERRLHDTVMETDERQRARRAISDDRLAVMAAGLLQGDA